MLTKFVSIGNVGRFQNHNASGDVELRRYTLVFAENGRGKTTLCAILRSLQSGDPSHILGRTTLGSPGDPQVQILLDTELARFRNGAWDASAPNIAVFDSTFVSNNVYSGDSVNLDHRRRLYRVIVGARGVELARRIDQLDGASRAKSTEIREKRAVVQSLAPRGMTAEAFVDLESDAAIAEKIEAAERERNAVAEADAILRRPALSPVTLPTLPTAVEPLLARSLEGVADDASRRVADQIAVHDMHGRGEAWLAEGVAHVRSDTCPFCSQPLAPVAEQIAAYRTYFSDAYNALRREIETVRRQVALEFGDRSIGGIERTLDQNLASVEYWGRFTDITPPTLTDPRAVGTRLRDVREAALALLDRKAGAPLGRLAVNENLEQALANLRPVQDSIDNYNAGVATANTLIEERKAATEEAEARDIDANLTRLRATQTRHTPEAQSACEDFTAALTDKGALEDEKATVRRELDAYTEEVIRRYEQTINQLLGDFAAGFRITGTRHAYPGGVASSTYEIVINDVPVALGDADTPLAEPSFKNTLSSGDRSTLALAFFLAQLAHDPDRASKIVVLDDPFNSQDSFRRNCTIQKIKHCGAASQQVLVLSHDDAFLKTVWDRLSHEPANRKALELRRIDVRNTAICEWDIEAATQAAYKADLRTLADYHVTGAGEPRSVVQKIRPVLETHAKYLGPGLIAENDTLGTIIGKIREAGDDHQLYAICDDLEELNDYTRQYHHGANPQAATAPINDTELHGYVRRTLDLTGGC